MNNKRIESKINLTPKTAYLTGFIIGDGNLANWSKSKTDHSPDYRISIDISDVAHLKRIEKIIKSIIVTKTSPKNSTNRGNRIPRQHLFIRNKKLFNFLSKDMQIPKGNKSSIVFVPNKICKAPIEIKKYFLAGYFDADGGFRGKTLGFTTASKRLNEGVSKLLGEFKFLYSKESWINKKYDKEFFGIRLRKKEIDKFLKVLPLQNKEKLIRICNRFDARMPEWSNGIDYSKILE